MQKPKPIEYLQAILYYIKYNWREILMAVLVTATGTLELVYAATNNKLCYNIGIGVGLTAVIIAVVIYAPELGKAMDRFGLRLVPEDEEV